MSKKLKAAEVWGEKAERVSLCVSCEGANELCKFKFNNADRSMVIVSCPKYREAKNVSSS